MTTFKRVTKREAQKRFNENKGVYLCPCKMRPGYPWNIAVQVFGKAYLENAETYRNHPDLWKGTPEQTAWALMYNNFAFYNLTNETGRYAHYYVEE